MTHSRTISKEIQLHRNVFCNKGIVDKNKTCFKKRKETTGFPLILLILPKFQQTVDGVHIRRAFSIRREGLWAVEPDGVWTSPPVLVLSPAGTQTHMSSASQSLSSAYTPSSAKFTLLQSALSQPGDRLWVTMSTLLLLLLFLLMFILRFWIRPRLTEYDLTFYCSSLFRMWLYNKSHLTTDLFEFKSNWMTLEVDYLYIMEIFPEYNLFILKKKCRISHSWGTDWIITPVEEEELFDLLFITILLWNAEFDSGRPESFLLMRLSILLAHHY